MVQGAELDLVDQLPAADDRAAHRVAVSVDAFGQECRTRSAPWSSGRVVAGVQQGEERGVQRGRAGAEHGGGLAVVEVGECGLQAELVGSGLAGVDEQVRVVLVQCGGVFGQKVGVRHHNGVRMAPVVRSGRFPP